MTRREYKREWMRAHRAANQYTPPRPLEGVSDELAIDILQRRADGYTPTELMVYSGLSEWQIRVIVGADKRRQWSYYRDLDVPKWLPLCMTAEEFALVRERGESLPHFEARPCDICTREFAQENRAAGTCNGTLVGEGVRRAEAA